MVWRPIDAGSKTHPPTPSRGSPQRSSKRDAPGEHGEEVKAVVSSHVPVAGRPHFVEQKIVVRHEPADRGIVRRGRRDGLHRHRPRGRLDALLDVQPAGRAVRPDAIPVVKPVGDVARLLDLRDHQSGTDRVDGARRDEDAVARRSDERVQRLVRSVPPAGPRRSRPWRGPREGRRRPGCPAARRSRTTPPSFPGPGCRAWRRERRRDGPAPRDRGWRREI